MKKGIHPEYGPVAFRDIATGNFFVTQSTLIRRVNLQNIEVGGVQIPVVDADITNESHPFWTGKTRVLDTEGRVHKFERKYGVRP